jgi:translation initiation factor 5A
MEVPVVKRSEYNLIDVTEEGYLHLMEDNGDIREDLHCNHNTELLDEIRKKFDAGEEMMISVIAALDREMPLAIKPIASKN